MIKDDRDVLEVLKAELNFIEKGGYGSPAGKPWVSTSAFQDSPSCLNFGEPSRVHPCSECLLIDFVPPDSQGEVVPCHHIPLTERGETVEELEQSGKRDEIDLALRAWLNANIARLERERPSVHETNACEVPVGKESGR